MAPVPTPQQREEEGERGRRGRRKRREKRWGYQDRFLVGGASTLAANQIQVEREAPMRVYTTTSDHMDSLGIRPSHTEGLVPRIARQ